MKKALFPLVTVLFLTLLLQACKKDDIEKGGKPELSEPGFADNTMVMYWNDKVNTVLTAPMNQPTRARLYAIMEIAVHDALNSIIPKYKRYALTTEREQFASPDAAVASAAYWVIKLLERQSTFPIDTWYEESLAKVPEGQPKEWGKAIGKKAAEAIIANRANDGFTQIIPASTTPANGTTPGAYRQTNVNNLRFLPNWGIVIKPFAVQNNEQFRPAGPYAVTSAEYAAEYNEVKTKGVREGSTRTTEESDIARFWSENRPSLLWNNFARAIITNHKMDAWRTARLFAIMHTAMADGITTALNANYHFYYWRPETAIQEGAADNNDATVADPGWVPFLIEVPNTVNPLGQFVSPPQPEYPSGFAMYGGAVYGTLLSIFKEDKISIDLMSASSGTARRYTSMLQAALDNSEGKIYAGWQFRKSVKDGQDMGKKIADYVIANHFKEE